MNPRPLALLLALWLGLPCAALAVASTGALPSPALVPARTYDLLVATQACFALFVWPVFVAASTEGLRAHAARLAILVALAAPLALACRSISQAPVGAVAASQFLLLLWLAGAAAARELTRDAGLWPLRAYVALAALAAAGLPLGGYLAAELHGAESAFPFLASPLYAIVNPLETVRDVPLWVAHASGFAAVLAALVVPARLLCRRP